jgi:hypothetical protein
LNHSLFRLGMTCLSFGIVACEAPPELVEISSGSAALTASENSERALQGLLDAADFLATSTSVADTLNALGGGSSDCTGSSALCSDDVSSCTTEETTCDDAELGQVDLEENRQELKADLEDFVKELRERILIEDNLESETATSATYVLGPDVWCDESDDLPDVSEQDVSEQDASEIDADCVEEVLRLQPRLRLTSPREGDIDLTLLLGEDQHAPLTLELHQRSLGVQVDLGQAFALGRDLGQELEGVEELEGVLELRLVENQARDYSLELNVLRALSLKLDADGEQFTASLGASSPAWNVRVDGNQRSLSAGIDLAQLKLSGPLRLFSELLSSSTSAEPAADLSGASPVPDQEDPEAEHTYTGILELVLAGVSGTLTYAADSDVLNLDDVGFGNGTSTLKHDANTLFALDLNPSQGRRVSFSIEPMGDGQGSRIRVSPSLDLSLAFAFHYVADQFEDIADYLLEDTLRVWFTGEAPALELGDAGLRVAAGTLKLTSSANPGANVSVGTGMCLVESSEADESAESLHPFAGFEAGACE